MRPKMMMTTCTAAALVLASAAWAQPADTKKQPASPAKPAEHKMPEGKPPEGMPDMKKMMEEYEKLASPGKMHEHLQKWVGTWEGKVTAWMMPGQPPTQSTCTTTVTPMMNGRFTRGETRGEFDMGPMFGGKRPFEGFGIYGYDNATKEFQSTWCDNMGTMMMHFTGSVSEDGQTLTWNSKFKDPMSGQDSWMREVERFSGNDSVTLEMWGPNPMEAGKEMKMMEIAYTRKGGAAPAKADSGHHDAKPGASAAGGGHSPATGK